MSGGSLSYFYLHLQEHIGDFGDEELDDLVKDLADLFYAREWYLSSDTCKDDWREARDKFKDKWFTEYGRQERIKKYIEEIRSDVLDMFGINDRKCDTCEYWSHESDNREVFSTCNPVVKADKGREMNDDPISRQAAIDEINERQRKLIYCFGFENDMVKIMDIARSIIIALPSAQPEIIRCKDCKYMTEHYDTDGNAPYWTCSEWDSGTDYDGFCHYAERRTDG